MALTINNTNTLTLLNILNQNSAAQSQTMRQLTTGKRINTGADDPAGLIALSSLKAEITAVDASINNNQRTDSILTVADGAVAEITSLLSEIERLVVASTSSANLTDSEVSSNQAQIDGALTAIDRIVNTTNFNGKRLLDGSQAIATTGVTTSFLDNVRVYSRGQGTTATTLTVNRVASAQVASASFAYLGGGTAATSGTTSVAITGSLGTATITIASGSNQAAVVTAINAAKAQTGVSAIQSATNVQLSSTTFGKDAFISVNLISGGVINSSYSTSVGDSNTVNDVGSTTKTSGVDVNVTINGQTAGTDGLDVVYNGNGISASFTLSKAFGEGSQATTSTSFSISATGGATFQLGTESRTRQTIGIDSLATYNLGGGNGSSKVSELGSGGAVDLRSDPSGALTSVREALKEIASVRGRLGGFQKFQVGSAIRSLQAAQTGLGAAASVIEDTDFAVATARLNQQQVLIQSTVALLGVAGQQSAQILSLL